MNWEAFGFGILSACTIALLIGIGRGLYKKFNKKYKIQNTTEATMTDLQKRMEKAEEHMENCPAYRVVDAVEDNQKANQIIMRTLLILLRKADNEHLNGEIKKQQREIEDYLTNK